MFSSVKGIVKIIVAKLPHTMVVLRKMGTEQLLSLVSLPDIPVPNIGLVIDVC